MTVFRRLWFFLTRWRRVTDLDDEMRLHVELRTASNRRRGLAPDEAVHEAKRRFGNPLKLREEGRDLWGFLGLERVGRDLRYALRQVIRRPASTLVIVPTLALGIGANTSVFTLVDAMLFRPAPWNHTDRLVWISSIRGRSSEIGYLSYADYLAYRESAKTLSGVLAFGGNGVSVGGPHPDRALGGMVSGNYFDVLGIHAALGRTITAADDSEPGAHPVVVLSDTFWKAHFGADPRVVNQVVAINGRPFTIVGVAPPGFTGIAYADNAEELWMPLAMQGAAMPTNPGLLGAADVGWLSVVGQRRNDVTVAQVDSEMRVIAQHLNPSGTPPDRQKSAGVTVMRGGMTPLEQGDLTPVFGLISIVPGLVLLVACANVANVLMVGHVSRRKEFAMRRAIGASRGRLIRQLLAESLVLALLSAAAGFALSFGLSALIEHYGAVEAGFAALLTPDRRALVATTAVAMLSTVVFGLLPAVTATRFDLLPALKDEGVSSTAARGTARWRGAFVVAQVALSLALVIVAGLFLQSLSKAMRVDLGFDPRGVVTASFDLDLQGYTAARRDRFVAELLTRAASIPGATSTALTRFLPLSREMYGATVVAEDTAARIGAAAENISPRYFETLRMPVVRGRDFSEPDTADASSVAIVNETLARRLWPGVDPLGKRFRVADPIGPWREVVGVVGDSKYLDATESPRAIYYSPHLSSPVTLLVRTAGDPTAVLASMTGIVRALDPDLPLFKVQTLEESIHHSFIAQRAVTSLLAAFGGLTLLLAAIGSMASRRTVPRGGAARSASGCRSGRGRRTCLACLSVRASGSRSSAS
jgi:predicted permease